MMRKLIHATKSPIRQCLYGLVAILGLVSCGGSQPSRLGASELSGDVTERAEGYTARPDWADPNRAWSRQGETLRVVGYVAIRADQRKEAGYRAADSYARAELIRFLRVRVVAVLEDQLGTGQVPVLREHIETTAQAFVDELSIAQHYYERRKSAGGDKLHVFSRLDIDQTTIAEFLKRAMTGATDLRMSASELASKVGSRWTQLASVVETQQDDLAPQGVNVPDWARAGDKTTDSGFDMVCTGVGKDEKTARALAQARCNEKLCRLFGVQITAKSKVKEDLNGVQAESEVSEQCADVRVVGRSTRYQTGECGDKGCVQWLLQSYPRSAYDAEKARLDQPTTITRQIVIQEGSKVYRDPAACEASLRAFAANTDDLSAPAFELRIKHLNQALKVCQEIDGRDVGLFLTLNNLLLTPLGELTRKAAPQGDRDYRYNFLIVTDDFYRNLETQRFLTDRIAKVKAVMSDAIVPMQLQDLWDRGGDSNAVQRAFAGVMKLPFVDTPASPHHTVNPHYLALTLGGRQNVRYHVPYRDYLVTRPEVLRLTCGYHGLVAGKNVVKYLAGDGKIDDQEWSVIYRIILGTPAAGDRAYCTEDYFSGVDHGPARAQRIEQVAAAILAPSPSAQNSDAAGAFRQLMDGLAPAEQESLYLKHRSMLQGNSNSHKLLVRQLIDDNYRIRTFAEPSKRAETIQKCEALPARIAQLVQKVPETSMRDTDLCHCLSEEGMSPAARRNAAALLYQYDDSGRVCQGLKDADWPEPYYRAARPERRSSYDKGMDEPLGSNLRVIEGDLLGDCLKKHSTVDVDSVVTDITATVVARKFTNVKVSATLVGEQRNFDYDDNPGQSPYVMRRVTVQRKGYVKLSDILAMKQNITECLQKRIEGFTLPDYYKNSSAYTATRPRRVLIQFESDHAYANWYVD